MAQLLKHTVWLVLLNGLPVLVWAEITVNALYPGKAAFTVDGEMLLMEVGQTQQGITLLRADNRHAWIEYQGKQQVLPLDAKDLESQPITPQQYQRLLNAKSHVISASLLSQQDDRAIFEVEYYYNDALAEHAFLAAKTLFRNQETGYSAYSHTPLTPGRHSTKIVVLIGEYAESSYLSDAVQFDIVWWTQEKFGITGSEVINFVKEWRR